MTKDRRLGRGLAALLGTPLEEDGIVDADPSASKDSSVATVAAQAKTPGAAQRAEVNANTQRTPQSASSKSPTSSGKNPTASKTQPASTSASSKKNKRPASKPVTGSVPLKATATSGQSLELSVYEIDNNPFQPRRQFNTEEIASLAESIREHKQLQPVLVRKVGDRYQLISGERRLRATIHAGLKTIRAEVREADDRLVAELAIVENLQRKDLDPIEKALSFRRYIDQHKCTQDDLAKRLKIDRSTIANLMRLLELPEEIQQGVQSGNITAGHARALLPLGEESQQLQFAKQIKEEQWSVRETERRVAEQLAIEDGDAVAAKKPGRKGASPQIAALEQQLRLSLGTKTEVKQSAKGRGKIVINFSNADEFDRLLSLICPEAVAQSAA
ncbi:MAG: ParB/RepB/Spo0J family partition protein [Aureliella sp.]